jgi:hypothetical protein
VTSLQGNTCAQIFTNGNFTTVHPKNSNARVAHALTDFTNDVGIPDMLLSDGAAEVTGQHTDFMKEVNRLKIRLRRSEAGRSNQNYAVERKVGELKKRWRNRMLKSKVPPRLWDYTAGDVTNAYLNAKCREKIWFVRRRHQNRGGQRKISDCHLCAIRPQIVWCSLASGPGSNAAGSEVYIHKADPHVWI